jgi:hypothetical protein
MREGRGAGRRAELPAACRNVIVFHIMRRSLSPLSLAAGAAERFVLAIGLSGLLWAAVAWAAF